MIFDMKVDVLKGINVEQELVQKVKNIGIMKLLNLRQIVNN